jgi:uncharacterized membrane protein YtjA (UPF0391 family)
MSNLAALSLLLALMSAAVTFTGLLGGASFLGRASFLALLVIFVITAAAGAVRGPPAKAH